ncbi:hypothetical protein M2452_002634 [Enterococcus sp. PFB1-1]|nr:hypothetical protein [Enterococcus sp. PFB1-1]
MKKRTKVGQPYKIVGNHLNRRFSSNSQLKKLDYKSPIEYRKSAI